MEIHSTLEFRHFIEYGGYVRYRQLAQKLFWLPVDSYRLSHQTFFLLPGICYHIKSARLQVRRIRVPTMPDRETGIQNFDRQLGFLVNLRTERRLSITLRKLSTSIS